MKKTKTNSFPVPLQDVCQSLLGSLQVFYRSSQSPLMSPFQPPHCVLWPHSYEGLLSLGPHARDPIKWSHGPTFPLVLPLCCVQREMESIILLNSDPLLTHAQSCPAWASTIHTVLQDNSSFCLFLKSSPPGLNDLLLGDWQRTGTWYLLSLSQKAELKASSL